MKILKIVLPIVFMFFMMLWAFIQKQKAEELEKMSFVYARQVEELQKELSECGAEKNRWENRLIECQHLIKE